jgi:hypothetical protein
MDDGMATLDGFMQPSGRFEIAENGFHAGRAPSAGFVLATIMSPDRKSEMVQFKHQFPTELAAGAGNQYFFIID